MNAKKIRNTTNPIINIYIPNKEILYNKFNQEELSLELSDYIDKQISRFSFKGIITIKIHSSVNFTKEEQEDIVSLIRRHYGLIISEKQLIAREKLPKKLYFLALGIILLATSVLFPSGTGVVTKELLSITSWIIIWETIENIIYDDTENKIMEQRASQVIKGKIEFIDN
jgi:hypothetical protein